MYMKNCTLYPILLLSLLFAFTCKGEEIDDGADAVGMSLAQRVASGLSVVPPNLTPAGTTAVTPTLRAYSAGSGKIRLDWNGVSDAASFKLYRDTAAGFTPSSANFVQTNLEDAKKNTMISSANPGVLPAAATGTVNKSLTNGIIYYFIVAAVLADGTERNSNVSSAIPSAVEVWTHAGSGVAGSANAIGYDASFNYPMGLSVDASGYIYVADSTNQKIRRVSPSIGTVYTPGGSEYWYEGAVTTFAGSGYLGYANALQPGDASFFDPWATCVLGTDIYVADSSSHIIRKITADGVVTTLAGTAPLAGSTDGTGAAARFNFPQGIACAGANVYVADTNNNLIRQIVAATGVVTTVLGVNANAGQNAQGDAIGDGSAAQAKFFLPRGLATDGTSLYIADSNNHRIKKYAIAGWNAGAVLAGSGAEGSADGTGTAAGFSYPRAVTVDGSGNVYVADTNNHLIRKITAAGVVTAIAGTKGVPGAQDGYGLSTSFNYPQGIAYDAVKTVLYVSDSFNHRIRRISGM